MRKIALLCSFIIVGLLAPKSLANLVLYEPFNYTASQPVLGQSNPSTGTSWLRAGSQATTTAINTASGTLAAPVGFTPAGGTAALTGIGNNTGGSNRLAFAPSGGSITSGSVFYSFSLRIDSLSGANMGTGGFFIGLNNTANSATTNNPGSVGARIQARVDPTDTTKFDLSVVNNRPITTSSDIPTWTGPYTVGDTFFIVASYDVTANVSNLWVDPSSASFGAASPPPSIMTDTASGTQINIASLILRQSPAPLLTLDEIRVGTAWADVTPAAVPEASAALFLAAGCAVIWRCRKR